MVVGKRIRKLRQEKGLSQGDMERATGLLRTYISRVEHGYTVPSLETLERIAEALGVPPYQLLYEGDGKSTGRARRAKEPKMSDEARLVFGTLAKAFSKL